MPANYVLNVANGACTKLAEQLASPGLVLPWLLASIGAPAFLVGFLAPIKQVGSLAPQLLVAARIRAAARRKWFWVGAGTAQALMLLGMIPAALMLSPVAAGVAIVALLAAFSVASGVGSVAFQDVVGKTIPKGRRGRLLANRAALGGALTLLAGIGMRFGLGDDAGIMPYLWLIAAAAVLWAGAALLFARIDETPGATEGGRRAIDETRRGMRLVRDVAGYRRYLGTRGLLTSIEIATPLYALHAHGLFGNQASALGIYVISIGVANIVSSPFWGLFSDRSSKRVMVLAGLIGAVAGVLALTLEILPADIRSGWMYAGVFVVLGIAMSGVRLGRKTYLVDAAPKDERPLYVAFANSAVGLVALVLGGLGLLAQFLGPVAAVAALVVLAVGGAVAGLTLPEADRMAPDKA